MASLMTKATKGNRAAITRLYEQTKKDAFFIAQQLLGDDDKAQIAVVKAYRETLALSALGALSDETAYKNALLYAVAQQAKAQITRQNPRGRATDHQHDHDPIGTITPKRDCSPEQSRFPFSVCVS